MIEQSIVEPVNKPDNEIEGAAKERASFPIEALCLVLRVQALYNFSGGRASIIPLAGCNSSGSKPSSTTSPINTTTESS